MSTSLETADLPETARAAKNGPAESASQKGWPGLTAFCSIACLAPLRAPLQSLLAQEGMGVLHAEQSFRHAALPLPDEALEASAAPGKTKEIRGSYIVQIAEKLQRKNGEALIEASTTLVLAPRESLPSSGRPSPPTSGAGPPRADTAVWASGTGRAGAAELIRYAGASGDFNPIHWDPEYARSFGFERPIVHGMLIYNWVLWTLAEVVGPLDSFKARIRFLSPLLSAEPASIRIYDDFSFEVIHQSATAGGLQAKGSVKTENPDKVGPQAFASAGRGE